MFKGGVLLVMPVERGQAVQVVMPELEMMVTRDEVVAAVAAVKVD